MIPSGGTTRAQADAAAAAFAFFGAPFLGDPQVIWDG